MILYVSPGMNAAGVPVSSSVLKKAQVPFLLFGTGASSDSSFGCDLHL